ncbi:ribosome small subunit-dependent GTPase A [Treponema primitia ZAS-2]|uniref:Small ribosomal subunit biogenesis GTPase RsgA n=1 Tax=Treponema primitia (strain ATCC BAA-887 / DSM 12427 / ZAS-2) TaxID=545694 RepID=F5YIG0_TREPZ|nr:ribosome small subunit-dependent GTPase A [Treponema primitia]AEF83970.1 ribosome small subunit-dependent GTPase A [Treponema primitia ZAS-2]
MTGLVIRGSRNIFTVKSDEGGAEFECHLKGKILKGVEGFYNPLAPGDRVIFESDLAQDGTGLILSLEKRRNLLTRFNQKGQSPQLLAANVDQVLCVTTPVSPPFRPRFLDRALLQGEIANIPAVIICNKYDLSEDDLDVEERLEDFTRIGYKVLRISAKTGEGMDKFRRLVRNRISAMLGQSGVGKSSLINALVPGRNIRVGAINEKFDRGNHTTTMSFLEEIPGEGETTRIIDTPGIRRFIPHGIDSASLILYLREFAPLAGRCSYGHSCSHVSEPGCKIMEAVHAGVIHEDRYESFLRIRDEMSEPSHD